MLFSWIPEDEEGRWKPKTWRNVWIRGARTYSPVAAEAKSLTEKLYAAPR